MADLPLAKDDIQVDDVSIRVGRGSPLPITVEIPLNLFQLSEGTYEVNVNGTVGTFEIPILQ